MFVYIVRSGKTGAYKIGTSKNVDSRLVELQVGNPQKLYLIAKFDFGSQKKAMDIEQKLHRMFRKQRIRGEWFSSNISLSRADAYFKANFEDQEKDALEWEEAERAELQIVFDSPIRIAGMA